MKIKTGFVLLPAAMVLLNPLFTAGQDTRTPADKKLLLHESISDPYIPNDRSKVSPAYKFTNTDALKTGTSIFTMQVNVDENGENILDDAANEPNIAVNPLNESKIVIGWRQFDNVFSNFRQAGWSYTSDGGQTWTFPGVLEPGIFRSDPVLDYDADGNFYYNSLSANPNFACRVFKSTNGGAAWDNGTDAGGGDKQWMAIDRTTDVGSGNIYSFWSSAYSVCPPGFFTRSTDGAISFEECTPVDGDPYWGTMAVGVSGELYIGGGSNQDYYLTVAKSTNAQVPASVITWDPPVLVYMDGKIGFTPGVNPEGLLGQVNIDVDRSNGPGQGNVYVVASLARYTNADPGDVMFSRSKDGGFTWEPPIRINDDQSDFNTQWLGTLSVAPNGRIDIIWLDTRDAVTGSDSSALYYSYSLDEGNTWSENEKLSASFDPHIGYPNQSKMGDYFDMVSDNTGAHLAWANTLNGEQDVYYSHIIPEINVGVHEIPGNVSISVFPNPTHGQFVIKSKSKHADIKIYNVFGREISSLPNFQTSNEIDISPQPAGIYFLKMTGDDGSTAVEKIIKE